MVDDTNGTDGAEARPPGPPPVRARHPAWWLVSAVLVAAAVVFALDRRHDLASAVHLISMVRPTRLLPAALFEVLSLACLAGLQQRLLRMGGARLGFGPMMALVVAANAVAGALPGGAAFAAAWLFEQLRRRRVSPVLAGSALAVAGLMSALTLFLLLVAGVLVSGTAGPGGLRAAVLWLAAVLAVLTATGAAASRFAPARRWAWRLWRRLGLRSRRMWTIEDELSHLVRHVRERRPGVRPWLTPLALALGNWLLDLACLAACAWGLGITLPWRGTLVAYTLTQMTGALRLTPGGLGIVETSLAGLLVLYGLRADQAIALTLLYRAASYWALQPIGWASWVGLTLTARRRGPGSPGGASAS
ncbi:lysylphosphatidylglycerol synthase transmembrane domain-containing protein [Kitasatospora paranensis]|uniref:Lysylphosphatidylglycerol synthase transmembrane domain-containing protein n=1 Tax=Kitasatospora paranensis TaxID=258053 RepID=A0ABW2FRB6_9ACTN